MSRIGKKPVPVPKGVEVKLQGGAALIKGPLGQQTITIPQGISVKMQEGQIVVERESELKLHKSLHGTIRQLLANAVQGVSQGFKKELLVVGSGYKAKMEGSTLVLTLGFSHQVKFPAPDGVKIEVESSSSVSGQDAVKVIVSGMDKQVVGQTAAEIRFIKPPDPYKGKGIRYADEVVHLKAGKSATGGA